MFFLALGLVLVYVLSSSSGESNAPASSSAKADLLKTPSGLVLGETTLSLAQIPVGQNSLNLYALLPIRQTVAGPTISSVAIFDSESDAAFPTSFPNGRKLVLTYPPLADFQASYLLDETGQWWVRLANQAVDVPGTSNGKSVLLPGFRTFVPSGPPPTGSDDGNWFQKVNDFVVQKIVPAAAVIAGALVGGIAGAAIAAGAVALVDLSEGATLSSAVVDGVKQQIQQQNPGGTAVGYFQHGLDHLLGGASPAVLSSIRSGLPDSARDFFDRGVALGVAQLGQSAGIDALKKEFPDKAAVLDEALTRGGSLLNAAHGIGGERGIAIVDTAARAVRQSKGFGS